MTPEELNEQTREDWRDLGFFYDIDQANKRFRLKGSRQGLLRFCDILNEYTEDKRNGPISEHQHYGPYFYLKLITWDEPLITLRSIRGSFEDFKRMSELIRDRLNNAEPGISFVIDREYSPRNEASLLIEVEEDGFDPAEADPLL